MNAKDRTRIVKHAKHLMHHYKLVDSGVTIYDKRTGLQMLRDALESAKNTGLISDYYFDRYAVKFPDGTIMEV